MSGVLIVIPVFNEADALAQVVAGARRHGPVLVVDDGSSDGSADAAARAGADVVRLARRRGKGDALRRGFAEARARGADRALTLDGDGQHDPAEIPRLLAIATREPGALVVGDRLGGAAGVIPSERLAAMRVAGFFIDWLIGRPLRDTQSGFRVYPARVLAEVEPRHGGFVFETEVLVRAAAAGIPIVATPVTARHFPERRSRFRPGRDGVAVGAYLAAEGAVRWVRDAGTVAAVLARTFSRQRMRVRHGELATFSAPYRDNFGGFMLSVAAFAVHRTAETWRGWWRDPRARRIRLAAAASALTPALLALALLRGPLRAVGADPVAALVQRFYSQERLAETFVGEAAEPAEPAASARPAA